jgi:hypothetical protein
MQPAKLDKKLQKVYERALPFLGVNCKIEQEWRALLEMYQGLPLPNFPLVALAEKASFLLGNWGFHGQVPSDALAMVCENLLVEVGLYGSPLNLNYENYGHLSTEATWFHNLWNLTHSFNTTLTFRMEDQVHGAREHDHSLMSEFFHVGCHGNDLSALNIVCCIHNLIHLSDTSQCNGITMDEFVVSDYAKILHLHIFPREEPLAADFRLWRDAIHQLCAGTTTLPVLLGRFIRLPQMACRWFTTADA